MASPFDEIDAAGQAAINVNLGEAVAFLGKVSSDYSQGDDLGRPQQVTTAVVSKSPRMGKVADGIQGRSSSGAARTHDSSELWLDRVAVAALDWMPKRDDVVIVDPDGDAPERYTIAAVYPVDQGDLQIVINEMGQENE